MQINKIFLMNILLMVIMFIQSLIVARLLGIENYGGVTAAISLILFIQNVIGLRTGELVLAYYDKNSDNKNKILKKVIYIDIKITLLILVMCMFSYYTLTSFFEINSVFFLFSCLLVPSLMGTQTLESVFICEDRIYNFTLIKLSYQLIASLIIVMAAGSWGAEGYIIFLSITNIFKTLILFKVGNDKFNWKLSSISTKNVNLEGVKNFTVYSYISSTFKSGVSNLDVLLLSKYAGSEAVGIYKVAKNLSAIPGAFMGSAWSSTYGRIVNLAKEKRFKEINKITNTFSMYFLLLGLTVSVPVYYLIDILLPLAYGLEFENAIIPLKIMLVGNFLAYSLAPYNKVFYIARGNPKKLMLLNAFNFFVILIGGLYFPMSSVNMAILISLSLFTVSLYSKVDIYYYRIKDVC